jgi:hypothetical protein
MIVGHMRNEMFSVGLCSSVDVFRVEMFLVGHRIGGQVCTEDVRKLVR